LGERKIVYAPGVPKKILRELSEWGFLLLKGEAELGPKYPASVYYNAATQNVQSVVNENSIITMDRGIAKVAKKKELMFWS